MKKNEPTKSTILKSWEVNAAAWISTLTNNEIKSRTLFTNQAIVDTILAIRPKKVLDAGCGEGWLTRVLHEHGIQADGFDGVKTLIEKAQQYETGEYFALSYDDIRKGQREMLGVYDAIVFNYALFEKENVKSLLEKLTVNLTPDGHLIIQTISDENALFANRSEDGWMTEDWKTLETKYSAPFKWYYRSAAEWLLLFKETGFELLEKNEIVHPETKEAFSVIYTVRRKGL